MSTADGSVGAVTKIVDHGPDNQRWNVVLMSDGYRSTELATFAADAQSFVSTLFAARPFDELQGCINVHRIVLEGLGERLSSSSKLRNDFESLELLRKIGQRAARRFLDQHYDDVGVRSSVDLTTEVYSERG